MLSINNIPLFSGLKQDLLAKIHELVHVRQYPKDVFIYCEDDIANSVFIVMGGSVKICSSNDRGRRVVMRIHRTGESFGAIETLASCPRFSSVMTREESTIAAIHERDFKAMLDASKSLWKNLIGDLSKDFYLLCWSLKNMALCDVHGRVINLLKAESRSKHGKMIITRKMTQQEIAERIGATRERVSFVLSELKQSGTLSEYEGGLALQVDDS